jgi:hypothetical protein
MTPDNLRECVLAFVAIVSREQLQIGLSHLQQYIAAGCPNPTRNIGGTTNRTFTRISRIDANGQGDGTRKLVSMLDQPGWLRHRKTPPVALKRRKRFHSTPQGKGAILWFRRFRRGSISGTAQKT